MISRIGKYEIQSEIGCGAFGRVYRAYDPQMRRDIAIKVLIADGDPELLARFRAEAGTVGNLKHKNIVIVYEYDDDNGRPYIAMELLDGQNLHQIINSQARLSLLEKVSIILQMAEGLACAHEYQVVHRDIKPANIMVLRNQDVKIMDFGIARVTAEGATRRTQQGQVVGTIRYMAPERISGADADICTDIFSFGVVCYELLTGKHPFDANDYAALIYKITASEPPPLHETIPGCPEILEYAVQRAMAKDREMRYQSMEEILFDLRPALLELSQQRSGTLLEQAEQSMRSGDVTQAQDTIRQALKLDPSNRRARSLHDGLLKEQQRREVRGKVDNLVHSGRTQLEERDYAQAIQRFESALRLDSTDVEVQLLLSKAKSALERNRLSGRLLSEARREMLSGNLDGAFGLAGDAVQADPENVTAQQLLDRVQQQVEQRNRRNRVEDGVRRTKELLARSDFAGARQVLAEFRQDAEPDVVAELGSRIDAEEAEHTALVREMHVREGIASARQQIQQNRLEDAETMLRWVLEECPDSASALKLLATVQEQREAERRKQAVHKITQEALALIQSQQFGTACEVLGEGVKSFPEDFSLHRLLDRAVDLQRAFQRSVSIRKATDEARELQKQRRLEEAIALIERTLAECGHDTALTDLKRQIDFEFEQQQYVDGLNKALTSGRSLLEQRKFAEAVATLETAAGSYPGHPDLLALLASARQANAEQQERQFVAEKARIFEKLARDQKWEEAYRSVESALQTYPYNTDLLGLANRAREGSRQQQRRENIARRVGMIAEAIAGGDLVRAETALRLSRQDYPGESDFQPLEEKFRQAQTEANLKVLADKVKRHFERNDLAGAAGELESAQSLSNQPQWQALRKELDSRQAFQYALGTARERAEQGDFKGAEQLLEELRRQNPKDPALAALDAHVRTLRLAKAREELIQRSLDEVEGLLRQRNFASAIKAAKKLQAAAGSDPRIAQILSRIEEEKRALERSQEVQQTIDEAVRLRAAGKHDHAERLLRPLERFEPRAARLLAEIAAERQEFARQARLQQLKQQIRELLQRGDAPGALSALALGAREFPEEPEWAALRAAAEQCGQISQALAAIRDFEQRRQYNAAIEVAAKALQTAPNNAELLRVSERLQNLRRSAMADLEKTVRFCLDQDELHRAVELLDQEKLNGGIDTLWQTLHWQVEERLTQEAALREAQQRIEEGDYSGAEQLLKQTIEQQPGNARARTLLVEVTEVLRRRQQDQAIRDGRQTAAALLARGHAEQALQTLEGLLADHPHDSGLADDRRAVLERIEVDTVNEVLARIAGLQRTLQWDAALEEAEKLAARYPNNAAVHAALEEVRKTALEERRRRDLARQVHQIETLIASRQWPGAEEALRKGQQDFPGEKVLEQLTRAFAQARRQNLLETLSATVQRCFAEGNLDEAGRQIQAHRNSLKDDAVWQNLNRQLEARRNYDAALRTAEELRRAGDYEGAEARLRQAAGKGAPDSRAAVALQAIILERLRDERETALRGAREEAEALQRSGKLREALQVLDAVRLNYPDDETLNEVRLELEKRIELEAEKQRQDEIQEIRARVEGFMRADDPGSAHHVLTAALRAFPGEPELLALQERLDAGVEELPATGMLDAVDAPVGDVTAEEAPRPFPRKKFIGAGIFAAALLAGGVVWHFWPPRTPALVLQTASLGEGEVGAAYAADLRASGGLPPYQWQASRSTLPPGLTLQASDGRISGTPTADGAFKLSIQVADAKAHAAAKALVLVIKPAPVVTPPPPPPPPAGHGPVGEPLQLRTSPLPHGRVGQPYTAAMRAGGGKTPYQWVISRRGPPPGLLLDAAAGLIAGTPSTAGTFDFSVRVSDAATHNDVKTFQIVIEPQEVRPPPPPPPPPPPTFACPAAEDPKITEDIYGGPTSGFIEWRGQHTAGSTVVVVITGKRATNGSISGRSVLWQGAPVKITSVRPPANAKIVEPPAKRNGWSCIALLPEADSVTIKWEVDWSQR